MNGKWWGLTMAVVAPWVGFYPCWALENETQGTRAVVVNRAVFIAEGSSTPVEVRVGGADSKRGWLGAQLAEVPPALTAHLPSAATGVMVVNVGRGSPAEQAGLKRYDVITAVNGAAVSGGVGGAADLIGAKDPGAQVALKLLREGKEMTLNITLASRPAGDRIDWVHEFSPDSIYREFRNARGKILSRDEAGNWHLEDLGELPELQNLPEEIRKALPGRGEFTTKVFVDDESRKSVNAVVVRDGETLSIQQEDGGPIVVQRTDKDGKTTEATYENPDALKNGDEEAYGIYGQTTTGSGIDVQVGEDEKDVIRLRGLGTGPHRFSQTREAWRQEIDSAFREARRAVDEARRNMDEARRQFRFRLRGGPGASFFSWLGDDEETTGSEADAAQVTRSFRVNPEGQIEALLRRGDTEVNKVFRDEADLQQRDPELYQVYREAVSSKTE